MEKLAVEKIAFIGGGVMGGAMITGLLTRKLISPQRITVSDVRTGRIASVGSMGWSATPR